MVFTKKRQSCEGSRWVAEDLTGRLVGDSVSSGISFDAEDDVKLSVGNKEDSGEAVAVVVINTVEGGIIDSVVVKSTVDIFISSVLIVSGGEELMVIRIWSLDTAVGVVIPNPAPPSIFDMVNMFSGSRD